MKILRWYKVKNFFTFVFYFLLSIYSYLLSLFLFFCLIHNLLGFLVVFLLVTGLFLFFLLHTVKKVIGEKHSFALSVEKDFFGRRRFVIDSYEEVKKIQKGKKFFSYLINSLENEFKSSKNFKNLSKKVKRDTKIALFLLLISTFLFIFFLALLKKPFISKTADLYNFLSKKNFTFELPDFYVKGEGLHLVFNDIDKVDKIQLKISNVIYEITSREFFIPEKWTFSDNLSLEIYYSKYGITSRITQKTLYGLEKFLPLKVGMLIYYPVKEINPVYIQNLESIEVFPEANVLINGEMSKDIKGVFTSPEVEAVKVNKNKFEILVKQKKTSLVNIRLTSYNGENFSFPSFKIEVKKNQPPVLNLEFPKEEVVIKWIPWKVVLVVNGKDDQGICRLVTEVNIENEDKKLKFLSGRKEITNLFEPQQELQKNLVFSSGDFELLPGDKAIFSIRAYDVFGVSSLPVKFLLYSPGFEWIEKSIQKEVEGISNIISFFESKKDFYINSPEDISEIEREKSLKEVSNIEQSIERMSELLKDEQNSIETLQQMKEILKKLKDVLENKDEFLMPLHKEGREFRPEFENLKEYLWQMNTLLDVLKSQQKELKKQRVLDFIEQSLNELKKENSKENFNKKLSYYKNFIKKEMENFEDRDKKLFESLLSEAEKLQMGMEETFKESERILDELKENIRKDLKTAREHFKDQIEQKLLFVLEEIVLSVMLLEENLSDYNVSLGQFNDLERIVINTKAIYFSVENIENIYRKDLKLLFIFSKDYYSSLALIGKIKSTLMDIQDSLRERYYLSSYNGFFNLKNLFVKLYFSIKEFLNSIQNSFDYGGEKENTSLFLSLNELVKLQQLVSMGLEKMLSEKGNDALKEELANLQKTIKDKFGQFLDKGYFTGGKDIKNEMDDIIKDIIEEKVNDKTIQKSKMLEEKLLKSQLGLKSKGIESERKATTAKEYEVTPPPELNLKKEFKRQLEEFKAEEIPLYYKVILERLKKK